MLPIQKDNELICRNCGCVLSENEESHIDVQTSYEFLGSLLKSLFDSTRSRISSNWSETIYFVVSLMCFYNCCRSTQFFQLSSLLFFDDSNCLKKDFRTESSRLLYPGLYCRTVPSIDPFLIIVSTWSQSLIISIYLLLLSLVWTVYYQEWSSPSSN